MTDELERRRQALEEAFFNKYNEELLSKLRARDAATRKKDALAAATGLHDEKVLDDLLAAGIEAQTLAALAIAPLVFMAWRDGKLEDRERAAVLRAADEQGLKPDHTAYKLIEGWLARNPGPQLVAAWRGYVTALRANLAPAAYAAMRADILERTRKIMRAAGGYLGFAHSTAQEKELLAKMEEILG
jgi:hypothetical protein